MIRRPPRSTQSRSSAASDVYKRQRTARQARRRPPARSGIDLLRLLAIVYGRGPPSPSSAGHHPAVGIDEVALMSPDSMLDEERARTDAPQSDSAPELRQDLRFNIGEAE